MKIPALAGPEPETVDRSLATLRRSASAFEALLYREMLKAMVAGSTDGGFFGTEAGSDTWEELFESGLSEVLADGPGLGLAKQIYDQYAEAVRRHPGAQEGRESADP